MDEATNKIVNIPALDFIPDRRGVGYVFFENMVKHRNQIAQIDSVTGEEDTFESLLQRSVRTAIKMKTMNIKCGDIVSICSYNHLNSCVPFAAATFLGVTIASLDPNLSVTDMKHLIGLTKPKIIFVSKESLDVVQKINKELALNTKIVTFGEVSNQVSFSSFLEETSKTAEESFEPIIIDDLSKDAIIVFSSGTTGLPKGIRISHQSLLGQTAVTKEQDKHCNRILTFASLYWGSTVLYFSLSLTFGCTRIIVPKFNIDTVWTIINDFKPTIVFISPFHIMSMYKTGPPSHINIDSLKSITIGGGPLSKTQMIDLKNMFKKQRIFLSYGLSEAGFSMYFKPGNKNDDSFIDKKPSSSGSGNFGFSYKIVDIDTEKLLGPNKKGELRLKSKYMLSGYFKMESRDIWDDDGYIKTGDIAYYDEDQHFYIIGRLKEMLKYQSFHVLPSNIENVLLNHPGVNSAVVIGIPHNIDGDHPMALVIPKNEDSGITENELIEFVNERVNDREKLRGGLKIIESFPRTSNGKVNRLKLKELFY